MLLVPGAPEIVLEQAVLLCQACDVDIDAALGWTRLSRQGRQSVRHVMHVAMVTHLLTRERFGAGEGDATGLIAAALTMNVGDMELHDQLVGRGGNLSAPLREAIRQHPQRGAAILQTCGVRDDAWIDAVRQHHETPDGAGYPRGLAAGEIHPYAQVLKVADIYCARLESPYYRFPSPHAAVRETFGRQREHLDPRLTSALFRHIGIYHPGILVRLANHEIGVIVRRGVGGMPGVLGIMGARGRALSPPQLRDITLRQHALRGCVAYDEIRPQIDLNLLWGYAGTVPA
jgi:HD-GYP domain-containing protein (c-di-GMP phosphodiesterase class II)